MPSIISLPVYFWVKTRRFTLFFHNPHCFTITVFAALSIFWCWNHFIGRFRIFSTFLLEVICIDFYQLCTSMKAVWVFQQICIFKKRSIVEFFGLPLIFVLSIICYSWFTGTNIMALPFWEYEGLDSLLLKKYND